MTNLSSNNLKRKHDDGINLYSLWKVVVRRQKIIIAIILGSIIGASIYCATAPKIYRLETYMKINIPTEAKELAMLLTKSSSDFNQVIFQKNVDDITNIRIREMIGTKNTLKVMIESKNREVLETALQQLISYIENNPANKALANMTIEKLNEKLKLVKQADNESDLQIKEIKKALKSSIYILIGINLVDINKKSLDLKLEKYHLEQEIKNYKVVHILEEPFVSKFPVKPNKQQIISLSAILGLILGIFIVFVMEYFEKTRRKPKV